VPLNIINIKFIEKVGYRLSVSVKDSFPNSENQGIEQFYGLAENKV